MSDPFDNIVDSRKLRREAVVTAIPDSHGQPVYAVVDGVITSLSADGAIDRAKVLAFLHCGHSSDDGIGGKCAEDGCNHISCKQCFAKARCSRCFKPLCLECLRQLQTEDGVLNLCAGCLDKTKRRRFWRAAGQCLLKPFRRSDSRKET